MSEGELVQEYNGPGISISEEEFLRCLKAVSPLEVRVFASKDLGDNVFLDLSSEACTVILYAMKLYEVAPSG